MKKEVESTAVPCDLVQALSELYAIASGVGAPKVISCTDEILQQMSDFPLGLQFLVYDLRSRAFESIKDFDAMISSSDTALAIFAESSQRLELPFSFSDGIYEASGSVNMVLDVRAKRAWLAFRHPKRAHGKSSECELGEIQRLTGRPELVLAAHLSSQIARVVRLFDDGGFAKAVSAGTKLLEFADELPVVHHYVEQSYRAIGEESLAEKHAARYLFYKERSAASDRSGV